MPSIKSTTDSIDSIVDFAGYLLSYVDRSGETMAHTIISTELANIASQLEVEMSPRVARKPERARF